MADSAVKLSTRDKNLRKQLQLSPDELAADLLTDQSPENIKELKRAIEKMPAGITTKGLDRKKLLQNELNGIYNSMAPIDIPAGDPTRPSQVNPVIVLDQVKSFLTNMWSKQ